MKNFLPTLAIACILVLPANAQIDSAESLLGEWVDMWASYDLNQVEVLFRNDETITYFSSEFEGAITGFDAIYEHHKGFGFKKGGASPSAQLWVDSVHTTASGESTALAALWYFGDPDDGISDQYGPMTMVVSHENESWQIVHMHFGNYPHDDD